MIDSTEKSTYRLLLKLALIAAGLALSNHEILWRLEYFLQFGHYFPLLVFTGIWGLAILSVLYVSFTPNQGIRTFWVIVIGLSTLLGETWFRTSAEQLSVADLDIILERMAMTAVAEIDTPDAGGVTLWELLTSGLMMAFLSTALLVSGMLMRAPEIGWLKPRWLGFTPLLPLGILIALVYYTGASNGNETRGMPNQYYNAALITAYALSGTPSTEKAEVEIPLTGLPAARHIVMIVDESVAGDFIDLNVPRNATPFLASGDSGAVNFGLAVSATNCSNTSNAVIRLGANPDILGQSGHSITNNPSIWKYATAAGFETTYINAQSDWILKRYYMNPVELALIDHRPEVSMDQPGPYRDFQALDILLGVLSRDEPQFVFLNKRGVYTPYYPSYPADEKVFTPSLQSGEEFPNRDMLFNTYRNAIRWSVDHFFEEFFRKNDARDFVIIYTSDHGQNLLDDGKPTRHCRRVGQTLYEAVVPMLVWTDVDELGERFEQAASRNVNGTSHFQVFPTILEMMGFDGNGIRQRYFETLFDTVDEPPGFATGQIMGRFGARPVWNPSKELEELER